MVCVSSYTLSTDRIRCSASLDREAILRYCVALEIIYNGALGNMLCLQRISAFGHSLTVLGGICFY